MLADICELLIISRFVFISTMAIVFFHVHLSTRMKCGTCVVQPPTVPIRRFDTFMRNALQNTMNTNENTQNGGQREDRRSQCHAQTSSPFSIAHASLPAPRTTAIADARRPSSAAPVASIDRTNRPSSRCARSPWPTVVAPAVEDEINSVDSSPFALRDVEWPAWRPPSTLVALHRSI